MHPAPPPAGYLSYEADGAEVGWKSLLLQHRAVLQLGGDVHVRRPQHPHSPGEGANVQLVVVNRHELPLYARGLVGIGRGQVQPVNGGAGEGASGFSHGPMGV